jgi:hypothetical protein
MVENDRRERWCVVLMVVAQPPSGTIIAIKQIGEFESQRLAAEAADQMRGMNNEWIYAGTEVVRMSEP